MCVGEFHTHARFNRHYHSGYRARQGVALTDQSEKPRQGLVVYRSVRKHTTAAVLHAEETTPPRVHVLLIQRYPEIKGDKKSTNGGRPSNKYLVPCTTVPS